MKILLISTQRCGSTWVAECLRDLLGTEFSYIPDIKVGRRVQRITAFQAGMIYGRLHRKRHIYKTHSIAIHHALQTAGHVDDLRVISVYRDFKDVLVSRSFFERYYRPKNREKIAPVFRKYVCENQSLSDTDFINGFVRSNGFRPMMENWADYSVSTSHPCHLRVEYEEMKRNIAPVLARMADFLDHGSEKVAAVGARSLFREGSGEEKSRFKRRGQVGDHHRFLTSDSIEVIDRAIEEYLARQSAYLYDQTLW